MKDISGEHAMYMNATGGYTIPLFVLEIQTWRYLVRFVLDTLCQLFCLPVPKIIEYLLRSIFGGTEISLHHHLKNTPHLHKIGTIDIPVLVSSSILNNWQGLRSMNGYWGDEIHV